MERKESMKNKQDKWRIFSKMTDLKLSNYIKYRWQKSLIKGLNEITKPNYGLFRKDISEI